MPEVLILVLAHFQTRFVRHLVYRASRAYGTRNRFNPFKALAPDDVRRLEDADPIMARGRKVNASTTTGDKPIESSEVFLL